MVASVMAWSEKILRHSPKDWCRDQQRSAFIASGDQLEQHTGLGRILSDVGDIVEDQQLVLVELGDGGFEPSSRRATWSRWTRSVVRMNSTRRPF